MNHEPLDAIEAVALLEEPNRRRLYDLVVSSHEPVGRDEAAYALDMSRELAAFHLDRLVEAGLLDTEFRRRSGRTGPGAGRPAKLYRRGAREVAVSLPPRQYDMLADVMATALDRLGGGTGVDSVTAVARERGTIVGSSARRRAGARPGRRRLRAALLDTLRGTGFEPETAPAGFVCLRNCPYDALVPDHRDLTCGMNLAWAEGVVDGLAGSGLRPELAPRPGQCCVVFRPEAGTEKAHVSEAIGTGDDPATVSGDL
jgi:predicted ArsR family transcriptional regulator